ncbi:hypothetical protein NSA50_18100 [Clostridium sp. DSM 100503]|uniref:hypothetical protein n=1 Tax=Clostridium sp. DSM 100503 TaxID=2963282 RepID=UPI00214A1FA5|nr:hypothetical protein [Clostridium sp. DSM 100503]MCR1952918.1 hypothetical protein [Clostridium sp. DSM 100503]
MDIVLNILKTLTQSVQLAAGGLFIFCLLKIGFKAMWSKPKREEVKDDLVWAIGGLILALGCFPIGEYIQSLINF